MTPERDASGLVVLDRRACLERLGMHRLASLAITDGALPIVLPAMYVLHHDDILVNVAANGILGRRMPNSIVSMCVHDFDDEVTTGWTVTVTGRAEPVTLLASSYDDLGLLRWGSPEAAQVTVRIATELISGRQVPPTAVPPS